MTDVSTRFKAGDILSNGQPFDPEVHRILKNGTVQEIATGKFLSAPAPEHAPITASNAQALARSRWENSRQEFAAGMAEGLGDIDAVPVQAWRRIGKKAMELLKDAKSPRGFGDLARFAGEAAGFVPMARGREEMHEQNEGNQSLVVVVMAQLVQQFGVPDDYPQVIDGEIKD